MAFKYIYGPVASWRLGRSLGVDLISTEEKTCSFDCVYCQVGRTQLVTMERRVFVPTDKVLAEIKEMPAIDVDYITFSGVGEPTLAANIGEVIRRIKSMRKEPIAVLTNSSLIDDPILREELSAADRVIAKLDAATQGTFEKINRPLAGLKLTSIIRGLCAFRTMFRGRLDLQIMFVEDNEAEAAEMAALARLIKPDEVEINTPLRPSSVKPLSPERLAKIQKCFSGFATRNVYERKSFSAIPMDVHQTYRRRPDA